jgi:putative endonuclease
VKRRERQFVVYILASFRGTLYTGVTGNTPLRLSQHRAGQGSEFAAKYKTTKLVYCEVADTALAARTREKQIKGWRREKKVALIESTNPYWKDLAEELWPGAGI